MTKQNILMFVGGFALGVLIGGFAVYKYTKREIEVEEDDLSELDDEIDLLQEQQIIEFEKELKRIRDQRVNYHSVLKTNNYAANIEEELDDCPEECVDSMDDDEYFDEHFEKDPNYISKPEMYDVTEPFMVSPEERDIFMNDDGYDIESWTIYRGKNGFVVADPNDEMLDSEEVDNLVGYNNLDSIFSGDVECLIIVNNTVRMIYDISISLENYEDVLKKMPFLNQGVL